MLLLSDVERIVSKAYGVYDETNDIAKPATFVLDKDDIIRWSYVGNSPVDRPFADKILAEAEAAAH